MKKFLAIALLLATPASAQQMLGSRFEGYASPVLTTREAAVLKCFRPWDDKDRTACIARAQR